MYHHISYHLPSILDTPIEESRATFFTDVAVEAIWCHFTITLSHAIRCSPYTYLFPSIRDSMAIAGVLALPWSSGAT